MRPALGSFVLLFTVACSTGTDPVELPVQSDFSFSKVNDPGRVDLIGSADLIVDSKTTQNHWLVRDEFLPADFCSVIEGGITPGNRRLLRFTVTTPNVGDADVFVGSPLQDYLNNGGLFELSTCHDHFHFKHYATYKLIDANTGHVWKSAKRGFCMLDTDPNPAWLGEPPEGDRNFYNCGTLSRDGFQGISHGWSDTYVLWLGGQYFVLDGGDGQPVVPPGDYIIEVEVNPPFAPPAGGCPRVTNPANGQCHQFAESDYTNNVGRAYITIPSHVGREGYGPDKNSNFKITRASEIDHNSKN
ncbi:MAG TPA: lysyl oxidase family protein [Gemmatimonadaceae bacterium]|nr:lysyl oxidase family protein [Gemmatimonadaceae bacterium]